jgi:CheY-like chemotaxis protein
MQDSARKGPKAVHGHQALPLDAPAKRQVDSMTSAMPGKPWTTAPSCRYDVVIMELSDARDWTVLKRLFRASANELVRRTPIVAMTANAVPEDRARCLAAGMID